MIYSPREDSYLLEKYVKKYSKGKSVLDMGSGSGIQAKAAQLSKAKYILASDINPESVNLLKKEGINAIKSDLFSNIKEKFDIIAFNPPYLPEDEEEDKESKLITSAGKKGDEIIVKFLKQAKNHLKKRSTILLIVSSLTPKSNINNIIKKQYTKKTVLETKSFFFETLEIWKIQ